MARRKSKGRGRSKGRDRRTRSAAKKPAQRSRQRIKRTTFTIETQVRSPKRTTVYEDVYEEEW